MSLCRDLKIEYESLQKLTAEFVSACAKGKSEGDFQRLSPQELRTLQSLKKRVEQARDALKEKLFVSPAVAERIMSEGNKEGEPQFFGIEAIEAAFNIKLSPKDIPPIRWSKEELKEAKERGEVLILRISHIPDGTLTGTPLTMQTIAERVQPAMAVHIQKKASRDTNWYEVEPFYTEEKPRVGWALVSKEPLSDSTGKNYLEQTERIVAEIESLYQNDPRGIPTYYQDAIEEFYQQRSDIELALRNSQWQLAVKRLAALSITTLTRHTAPEAFYDLMLLRASTKTDFILSNIYTWTSSHSLNGSFIGVGNTDTDNARMSGWRPHSRILRIGVLFSRLR